MVLSEMKDITLAEHPEGNQAGAASFWRSRKRAWTPLVARGAASDLVKEHIARTQSVAPGTDSR
jgi:hypothetical protein